MAPTSAVIVTGGASGIGRACAEAIAAQGRAVAVWDLNTDGALAAAQEIANKHNVATFGLGIDVTKTSELASAVDASRSAVGALGGLVHAAGTVRSQSVGDLDDAGCIASIEGWIGNAAIPAYCASKAGMLGVVRSMADKLGPEGIRVNAICPGFIETPMLGITLDMPGMRNRFEESSVLKRIGQPSEIGEPAAFLLSDKASFITGQSIIVDGGVLATA